MVEFYSACRYDIDKGNFPLNHDCILKVEFVVGSFIRFQYFSCRSQDSGQLMSIISKLSLVRCVEISSVDELPDDF